MTYELIRNDKLFDLEFQILDADGTAVDLTGYSTIRFKMMIAGGDVLKINGVCSVTNAIEGRCKYTIQDGDLDTAGDFDAEIEITYTSGKVITTGRFYIRILEDLPAA